MLLGYHTIATAVKLGLDNQRRCGLTPKFRDPAQRKQSGGENGKLKIPQADGDKSFQIVMLERLVEQTPTTILL